MKSAHHSHRRRTVVDLTLATITFLAILTTLFLLLLFTINTPAQTISTVDKHYERGIAKYQKRDFDEAISEFEMIIADYLNGAAAYGNAAYPGSASPNVRNQGWLTMSYENMTVVVPDYAAAYCGRGLAHYSADAGNTNTNDTEVESKKQIVRRKTHRAFST